MNQKSGVGLHGLSLLFFQAPSRIQLFFMLGITGSFSSRAWCWCYRLFVLLCCIYTYLTKILRIQMCLPFKWEASKTFMELVIRYMPTKTNQANANNPLVKDIMLMFSHGHGARALNRDDTSYLRQGVWTMIHVTVQRVARNIWTCRFDSEDQQCPLLPNVVCEYKLVNYGLETQCILKR